MKIYKNFYFWYALIFIIVGCILYLLSITESGNSFSQISDFFTSITFYMLMGFLPVGFSQVLMSIAFCFEKRKTYWLFYFIPLTVFICSIIALEVFDYQEKTMVSQIMGYSAVVCYITHLVLYHFHTKNKTV